MSEEHTHSEDDGGIMSVSTSIEIIFYLLLGMWLTWIILQSYQWTNPDDWMFPRYVGMVALLLVLLKLSSTIIVIVAGNPRELIFVNIFGTYPSAERGVRDRMSDLVNQGDDRAEELRYPKEVKLFLIALGWIILSLALVYLVGFFVVVPLSIFAFLFFFGKGIKLSILLTVVYSIFLFFLYVIVIGIIPYNGILF